jgi:hypothetical protein
MSLSGKAATRPAFGSNVCSYDGGIQVTHFKTGRFAGKHGWRLIRRRLNQPLASSMPRSITSRTVISGSEGSAIIDRDGKPLTVYHGTDADFSTFADGPAYFSSRWDYSSYPRAVVRDAGESIKTLPETQSEIEHVSAERHPGRTEGQRLHGRHGLGKPGDMLRGRSGGR